MPREADRIPDAPLGALVDGTFQQRAKQDTAESARMEARLLSVRGRFDWTAPSDNPLLPPSALRRVRSALPEGEKPPS
ncbi:hypothetical protein MIU24_19935 [Streptomyces venezuelae]|uniref:hypothetical protein n=1 Tax=Streptomyces sp. B6(2022) TaxID=3404749 RepID=UPI00311D9F70